jgi:hypothetical protein
MKRDERVGNPRIAKYIVLAAKCVLADLLFCLLYFWAAMLSYSLWFSEQKNHVVISNYMLARLWLPTIVTIAERFLHGPSILVLVALGVVSPLCSALPLLPVFVVTRKASAWIYTVLFLLWVGGIFALGFLIPRVYPLLFHT